MSEDEDSVVSRGEGLETTGLKTLRGDKAAAMFELLPAWLRFLESCGLIDTEQHTKSHQDIEPLVRSLRQIWDRHLEDPSLQRGLQAWWG